VSTLRLGPAERSALAAGARSLGIEDLGADALDRIEDYVALLDEWSARMNLISCRDAAELVERHLLDSIALVPLLPPGVRVVDLGSGAGLPGIPLAIAGVFEEVALVESRRRRASFLRTVKRELGLTSIEVLEQRAELGPPDGNGGFAAAVCRAVWSDDGILPIASSWLATGGRLFWMRQGSAPQAGEPATVEPERIVEYRIGRSRVRRVHVFALP
jgi:16S rRNA (guanine527-N7)-methyltransferase